MRASMSTCALEDLLSRAARLAVDDRTNVIIARDVSGNLNRSSASSSARSTPDAQVLIEARIVEATSATSATSASSGAATAPSARPPATRRARPFPSSIGLVGGASDATTPTAGLSPTTGTIANPNFAVNLPATVGTGPAARSVSRWVRSTTP